MIRLRPYQEKALSHADKKALLLDMGVGTGKTITSLALADKKNPPKVLVVVPAALTLQWYKVITEQWGEPSCLLYRGTKKQREQLVLDDYKFIVLSYNLLRNDFKRIFQEIPKESLIIIDEAQALKNRKSKIFKAIAKLKNLKQAHLLMLSATIISAPEDAYAIIKLLNPKAYQNYQHFAAVHLVQDEYNQIIDYKNLDHLSSNLYENSYRVSEDVLSLEEPIIIPVPYELDKKHMKAYNQILEDEFLELEDEVLDFTQAKNMFHLAQQLVISHPVLEQLNIKPYIFEVLDTLVSDKIIIFTHYVRSTESIASRYNAGMYYSKEKDLTKPIIVINLQAGGAGLDGLQSNHNEMIFVEMPLTPPEFKQAVGRLHRSGQTKPVIVHIPYAVGTIQESLYWRLKHKTKVLNKITKNELKEMIHGK